MIEAFVYVVRNSEGKFFRAKGFGGYGDTWVADIIQAKIYGKITPARSRVSFFSLHYPQYPRPVILRLKLSLETAEVVDETERIQKVINRRDNKRKSNEIYWAKKKLKQAQEDFDKAQQRLQQETANATNRI